MEHRRFRQQCREARQREMTLPPRPPIRREPISLTDDSHMPFGKWGPSPKGCGAIMRNVPSEYLEWFITNCQSSRYHEAILQYKRRRDAANT